jgi:hypothetical protein
MSTAIASRYGYPYEEFVDHMRAMKTVRQWEFTWRFGYLGPSRDNQAEVARTLEYFFDSYADQTEALFKAERFLSICDYTALHVSFFAGRNLVETEADGSVTAEPALLRAIHYIFTALASPRGTDPRKVVDLARSLKALELSL